MTILWVMLYFGFRASICTPFYFYDLRIEELSNKLKVHPFSVMDATFKYYLKLNLMKH